MNTSDAAEHLDLILNVLRNAEHGSPPALQFIVWGVVGVAFNVAGQLVSTGIVGPRAFLIALAILAIAIPVSIWDARRRRREASSFSLVSRLAAATFVVVFSVMTVVTIMIEITGFMPAFAPAVFYAAGGSSALLALGIGLRSTALTLGGFALVVAIVAASLVPAQLGTILAAGNIAGFILPGCVFALGRKHG